MIWNDGVSGSRWQQLDADGRDAEALAHLRHSTRAWGAAAKPDDISHSEWTDCLARLRAAGHQIDTTTLTGGDRAGNDRGYQLRETDAGELAALPPMPPGMREQAEQAAAAYAAGELPDGPVDDPAWIAARIADLHAITTGADSSSDPHLHVHSAVQNHGTRRDAEIGDVAAPLNDPWSDPAFIEDSDRNRDDVGAGDPWADYRVYTRDEAAAALVERGIPPDQAQAVVERYLGGLTWDGWSPQDQWQIDDDDLDNMLSPPQWRERDEPGAYGSTYGSGYQWTDREFDPSGARGLTDPGPPVPAGPVMSAEAAAQALASQGRPLDQARADIARYLDDLSATLDTPMHAWGLDDADLDAIRADHAPPADEQPSAGIPHPRAAEDEQDRRDQLNRWQHTDHGTDADAATDGTEDGGPDLDAVIMPDEAPAAGQDGSGPEVTR